MAQALKIGFAQYAPPIFQGSLQIIEKTLLIQVEAVRPLPPSPAGAEA